MAWYYGTFACGHDGRVNVIGPGKIREWKIENRFSKLCPECWDKKVIEDREKSNEDSLKKSLEMELPVLKGTEKQIAWANTLRQNLIDACESKCMKAQERYGENSSNKVIFETKEVLCYILENKTSASWFIDNRDPFDFPKLFCKAKEEMVRKDIESTPEAKNAKAEATVYPQNAKFKEAAEISIDSKIIKVVFLKNDEFKEVVKSLNYEWSNGYWKREIKSTNGTVEDRAAELGNKLLNAGFPIMISDSSVRQNAIDGNFEFECRRWIGVRTDGDYAGWLYINWTDGSDLYDKARKLPSSKWNNPSVVVKINYYKEVEEFADLFGFRFTNAALKSIESQKEIDKNKKIVKPIKIQEPIMKDGLQEILDSGDDIIDDLKD